MISLQFHQYFTIDSLQIHYDFTEMAPRWHRDGPE